MVSITENAAEAIKEVMAAEKFSPEDTAGATLDYSSGISGRGFYFTNPNAAGSCGCGNSFSA
jgi:iron-sulfur cluster assembly protein